MDLLQKLKKQADASRGEYSEYDYKTRAKEKIAQGALTNSKRPSCFVEGVYPQTAISGSGIYLTCTNKRRYIDFICGLGTNLLGYGNTLVSRAIERELKNGACLSLSSTLEVHLADMISEKFSFIDTMKFMKTGSDACLAAVKIARSATGRKKILSSGYHGWGDIFTSLTPPADGVEMFHNIRQLVSVSDIDETTAAVIVEPIELEDSTSRRQWLQSVRDACTRHKALLIFDEIITALRVPKLSVAKYYGIHPDMIVLGKALGNGLPITLVGGSRDLMHETPYFVSGTFFGERYSIAAAIEVLRIVGSRDMNQLWAKGQEFINRFNSIDSSAVTLKGYPTRSSFEGDPYLKALFFQEACKAGILLGPSFFFTFDHIHVMDQVLSTFEDIFRKMQTETMTLQGKLPIRPYSQEVRGGRPN